MSRSKRTLIGFVGGVSLLGCVVMVAQLSLRSEDASTTQATLRSLLTSDEFADVSASTMADTTNPSNRAEIRQIVVMNMKPVVDELEKKNPQTFGKAASTSLSMEQQDSFLAVVGSMKDPRLQDLGLQIAAIAQKHSSDGLGSVQQQLALEFQNRRDELAHMRDALFPGMRKVERENCRLFQGPSYQKQSQLRRLEDNWPSHWGAPELSSNNMSDLSVTQKLERALAIIAGILEQARVGMTQAGFLSEAFGAEGAVPRWATAMVGGLAFLAQLASCIMQSNGNSVLEMMCPMKYASAAADFLASFESILDIVGEASSTESPTLR
jgi:Flp pilus assembly protein protease CpaA